MIVRTRHMILLCMMLLLAFTANAQRVMNAECFWDTDPGQGSGSALSAIDGNFSNVVEGVMASSIGLPTDTGAHTFNIRVQDTTGTWGPTFSFVIDVRLSGSTVRDIKVTQAEYYWNTDPGVGNGTAMLAIDGNFDEALEAVTQTASLPGTVGAQLLGIRVKDVEGNWGPTFKMVISVDSAISTIRDIKVTQAEYYWNTDPGVGNATAMLATDGNFDEALEAVMATASLPSSTGAHLLGIRVKDVAGNWGPTFRTVVSVDSAIYTIRDIQVTQAEYFWDTDPGAGNATAMLAIDGNFDEALEAVTQTSSLPSTTGAHKLGIRVKDVEGNWGPTFTVVVSVESAISTIRDIKVTAGEYFFNTDPGAGNATPMLASDGNFNEALEAIMGGNIPVPVVAGVNRLSMRVKDVAGNWGPLFSVVVNVDTSIVNCPTVVSTVDTTICEGQTYAGYSVTGQYTDTLTVGGCDSIRTLNLTVLDTVLTNISQTICAGDSYLGYTATGVYPDVYTGANGCDSTRVLTLTVTPLKQSTVDTTVCFGGSVYGYSTTGIYSDTFSNTGCDSIRTLNLTVLPQNTTTISQTICSGQSYAGYTASGTYTDTYVDANGCDSVRTLNLTVTPWASAIIDTTVCFGEMVAGYSVSGSYIDTFSTAGCDSIRTLNLTVRSLDSVYVSVGICAGQNYEGYTTAGTYTDHFVNRFGCDSTRVVDLSVSNYSQRTIDTSICFGQSYLGYTTTGIYRDTFATASCDSIRILDLTVYAQIALTVVDTTVCFGETVDGYATTGNYTDTLMSATGCDSIRTLDLVVLPENTQTVQMTICEGQTYEGYDSTDTYTDVFTDANGCDSTRVLELTVLPVLRESVTMTICDGESYEGYTMAGTYVDTFSNGACDSIRTLNLSVDPSVNLNQSITLCQGDSVLLGGVYVSSIGTYADTIFVPGGCDTILSVNVTVYPQTAAPNVITNGNILETTAGLSGYQWYQNGAPVAGGNGASLAVIADGDYHVVITDVNGCMVSSDTVNVVVSGIEDINWAQVVDIYPNPVEDQLTISVKGMTHVDVKIYNSIGQLVYTGTVSEATPNVLDVSIWAAGMYHVKLTHNDQVHTTRVARIR